MIALCCGFVLKSSWLKGATVLKDKLNALKEPPPEKQLCSLGKEMQNMDRETVESLVVAMGSKATTLEILQVLQDEGIHSFGISHLRDKRRTCFVSENKCPCLQVALRD